MRTALDRFRAVYGSHPLHLLTLIAGFALFGYVLATIGRRDAVESEHVVAVDRWSGSRRRSSPTIWCCSRCTRWPTGSWSQAVDCGRVAERRFRCSTTCGSPRSAPALTLLVFLPGIIQQGGADVHRRDRPDQEPFLGRWLLLTAAMFAVSAVVYGVRLAATREP